MKFFIDTCDIKLIANFMEYGLVDGVTTNPSIISTSDQDLKTLIGSICDVAKGLPVSVEVVSQDAQEMIDEGILLRKLSEQVVVKLPTNKDGVKACLELRKRDIPVNMTLCFSPLQAILAAKAGATYISPFIGRLDDVGEVGMNLLASICDIYSNYPEFNTQILVSAVRGPLHIVDAAEMGADIVTVSPTILEKLFFNPMTEKGLDIFLQDWKKRKV